MTIKVISFGITEQTLQSPGIGCCRNLLSNLIIDDPRAACNASSIVFSAIGVSRRFESRPDSLRAEAATALGDTVLFKEQTFDSHGCDKTISQHLCCLNLLLDIPHLLATLHVQGAMNVSP